MGRDPYLVSWVKSGQKHVMSCHGWRGRSLRLVWAILPSCCPHQFSHSLVEALCSRHSRHMLPTSLVTPRGILSVRNCRVDIIEADVLRVLTVLHVLQGLPCVGCSGFTRYRTTAVQCPRFFCYFIFGPNDFTSYVFAVAAAHPDIGGSGLLANQGQPIRHPQHPCYQRTYGELHQGLQQVCCYMQ